MEQSEKVSTSIIGTHPSDSGRGIDVSPVKQDFGETAAGLAEPHLLFGNHPSVTWNRRVALIGATMARPTGPPATIDL